VKRRCQLKVLGPSGRREVLALPILALCFLQVSCDSRGESRSTPNQTAASQPSATSTPTPTPPRKFLSPENWSRLHDADIVFIRSRSSRAALIAQMANADAVPDEDDIFTHCGIVFWDGKDWRVYEGAGRGTLLDLSRWQIAEAVDKKHPNGETLHNVYVRRWAAPDELTPERKAKLLARAKTLHNTPYDNAFSWSDECAYCSELIWKAYDAAQLSLPIQTVGYYLGKLPPKMLLDIIGKLNDPGVCKECRNGKKFDSSEQAVSPEDVYQSDKLVSVVDDSP